MAQAPIAAGEKSTIFRVRVNESLADEIDELVEQQGTTRSLLVREAVRQYLEQEVAAS